MESDRFRWVFCQLEILRNCLPQNVRQVLQELPASLDETYERMLGEILKANPNQAYRLLQCLTVATRPLRVDELAEILAIDFNGGKDGIPVLNTDWRSDDVRNGVLATCSSLIVVVEGNVDYEKTRVVQFAHFSVKEFLTSDRLANIEADISRFHIQLEPAHITIAQSCLAILLQSDQDAEGNSNSALYSYAARHWVDHAHIGDVSLHIKDGMRHLFDPAKPYFTTWRNSCGLDIIWSSFLEPDGHRILRWKHTSLGKDDGPLCLYYAALCGFRDITGQLIAKYPQHINATVGENRRPLVAALCNRHIHVAELLRQHGAVLPIGYHGRTLLHAASQDGLVDVVQWLLKIGVDSIAREDSHRTPLHYAAANGRLEIARILLGHGAHVTGIDEYTPLHQASSSGCAEMAQLLIEHGADVHARDRRQSTPLHRALSAIWMSAETVKVLIEHGADVHARDRNQSTPLHRAQHAETVKLLIEHGADVHARDKSQSTPLHLAQPAETVKVLIEHGADVHARDQTQSTPLHRAMDMSNAETAKLLIEHGADVHARDESQSTPLYRARSAETAKLLIEHGADVHARDQTQSTPLHRALDMRNNETAKLLIEHGADIHARDENQSTPLHRAQRPESVKLLIEHGADVHARDQSQLTPLHLARDAESMKLLIEHGADVHARDQTQLTPLHLAPDAESMKLLIEHGADIHAREENQSTPLHGAPDAGCVKLLIEHGADVHALNNYQATPLHYMQDREAGELLIKHGADIHAQDENHSTPLHSVSSLPPSVRWNGPERIVRLLIEHGAGVNAYDKNYQTPLHRLSSCRRPNVLSLSLLLESGADVDLEDDEGFTPIQIALVEENYKIARLLLDHRARIMSNTTM